MSDKMSEPTIIEAIYDTVKRTQNDLNKVKDEQVQQGKQIAKLEERDAARVQKSVMKAGAITAGISSLITGIIMLIIKSFWP